MERYQPSQYYAHCYQFLFNELDQRIRNNQHCELILPTNANNNYVAFLLHCKPQNSRLLDASGNDADPQFVMAPRKFVCYISKAKDGEYTIVAAPYQEILELLLMELSIDQLKQVTVNLKAILTRAGAHRITGLTQSLSITGVTISAKGSNVLNDVTVKGRHPLNHFLGISILAMCGLLSNERINSLPAKSSTKIFLTELEDNVVKSSEWQPSRLQVHYFMGNSKTAKVSERLRPDLNSVFEESGYFKIQMRKQQKGFDFINHLIDFLFEMNFISENNHF